MKNYTITVNGNVYDVTVEENGNGAAAAPVAAPKADRKSTRLNSSHIEESRMPSSA